MIPDIVTAALMLLGVFFMMVGAIGIVRMPDLYTRMSATTKSATLGVSFMLLAAAAYFGDPGILERAVATVAFLFVTAPVAAHMIARAAYIRELALWEGTVVDELEGQYDLHHNRLAGAHTTHNRDAQPAPEADPWP